MTRRSSVYGCRRIYSVRTLLVACLSCSLADSLKALQEPCGTGYVNDLYMLREKKRVTEKYPTLTNSSSSRRVSQKTATVLFFRIPLSNVNRFQ